MPSFASPTPFPTDWPRHRFIATRRAMKSLRIADRLLRRGLAYTPTDATDDVIRAAAAQMHLRPASETTCAQVRALLELLLPAAVTDSRSPDKTNRPVPAPPRTSRPTT